MSIIPNISVDCVVFGFDFENLNVLLEERKLKVAGEEEYLVNDYTIIGYHVNVGETLDMAAKKTLQNKTGINNIYLEQFYTFGGVNRLNSPIDQLWIKHSNLDIADHVFSTGYVSLVDSRAINPTPNHNTANWFAVKKLPKLGFDHAEIIQKALEHLRAKIRVEPIIFELLPEKFTISQLQRALECILDITLDRRNFRKKVLLMKYIIPLDEKQTGVAHKPAQVFIFSKDVYQRTKSEKSVFFI